MVRKAVCLAAALCLVATPTALAAPEPEPAGTNDFGGFRNIIPPGQNGHADAAQTAAFLASDGAQRPPNASDQIPLYDGLLRASPGLAPNRLDEFFKSERFGVPADEQGLRYSPRDDVTIVRENKFGVPSIYGSDRRGAMFGAGYIGAEDRLFLMDVLRHTGRAQLSSFIGGSASNRAMDAAQWQIAPYTEADLQKQFDQLDDLYGQDGKQLQEDITEFLAGINKYICETQALRPDCSAEQRVPVRGKNGLTPAEKLPGVYAAITPNGLPDEEPKPRLFTVTDLIAEASLVGGIFGKGGGDELGSSLVLEEAIKKFGDAGRGVWGDFRSAEDPEASTTVDKPFPYLEPPASPAPESDGRPDAGTTEKTEVVQSGEGEGGSGGGGGGGPLSGIGLDGLGFPSGASNALLVSGAESDSGRPVTVFGPQVSYFSPEILVEQDMHAPAKDGRPGIDARGTAFPGVNLYVQLGRGRDYAWSATSASQDIVDTFAVDLCEPGGGAPTKASNHYMYRGKCEAFEVLERRNTSVPNAADMTVAPPQVLRTLRSKLGLVVGRAVVDGRPTAYTQLRTTYMHEADSALGFADYNNPERMENAEEFQRASDRIGFTFNWFYTDDRDIAYYNSGFNPVRDPRADPNFPVRACPTAACEFEWRNFDPERLLSDRTPFEQHPQAINPPYLSSWNNKPAPGYRAADDNYTWQSVHRNESLDDRVRPLIEAEGKSSLTELLDRVQDAATVDVRGSEVLPVALDVLGAQSGDKELAEAISLLRDWSQRGAHRIDRNGDGTYEDAAAIALMDAWWPRLVEAQFKAPLGEGLYKQLFELIELDDSPNSQGEHQGSAYIAGWYGYVDKDLRAVLAAGSAKARAAQAPKGEFSRRYCGNGELAACRTVLADSLRAALAADDPEQLYRDDNSDAPGDQPLPSECEGTNLSRQMCFDSIVFAAVGVITQPAIPWQNRPTFQQVVEVQGHRSRAAVAAPAQPAAPAAPAARPAAPARTQRTPTRRRPRTVARRRAAPRAAAREAGGSLPFTGLAVGGIALTGLGLAGTGLALRRRTRGR